MPDLAAAVEPRPGPGRARSAAASLVRSRLRPPPELTVSEWADAHRVLPTTSAEPGPWRTARTPYLREVMDAFSDPEIERVVFMKSAQIGGSECLNNVIGYFIDQDPCPILYVQTSDTEADKYSKERIAPMISDCPVLRAAVATPRSREGTNTVDSKDFVGGHLGIVGANVPSKLRARPRRVVLFDDVDGFPASAGNEGDPVELGVKRATTFWNRKIGLFSTPTVKNHSRIARAFEGSTKAYYHVPCPSCGRMQRLVWEQLKWERDEHDEHLPETARYECAGCGMRIAEQRKAWMLERGTWVHTQPGARAVGFHLNALYSPWFTWAELAEEWVSAQGDQRELRVFVNTRLAETFEERGDAPAWKRIYERRESWPIGQCPDGVMMLTVGADVQVNRIEAAVWGWGVGKESWLVDHRVLAGDPFGPEPWKKLTALLQESWPTAEGGELPVARLAVDTGYARDNVVAWAWEVADRRVMLIKGDHWKNWTAIVGSPSKSDVTLNGRRTGLLLWPVGGALVKLETYGFLRQETPAPGEPFPPGYIHLPRVDREVVEQMVAEDLEEDTDARGFPTRRWVKNRNRNEQLDMRVYARAAAEQMGISRLPEYQVAPPESEKMKQRKPASSSDRNAKPGRRKKWLQRRGGWLDR